MQGRLVLEKYTVGQFIGRGSMGQVYLATPTSGGIDVVVKFMHDKIADQPRFREQFASEMALMARFRHPHAVQLLESSLTDPAGPCIVMEYVPGAELQAVMELRGRYPADELALIVLPLCQALHAAHTAGIIHRDLKPANVRVTEAGGADQDVKVMDLGLASLAYKPHIPVESLRGSTDKLLVGSPAYMCPEHIRGDATDSRGDLYSLGVILYEALTGRLPFEDDDIMALLDAHVKRRPPSFASIGVGGVPASVEQLVLRLLSKFPNERPQTAFDTTRLYLTAIGVNMELDPTGFAPRGVSNSPSSAAVPIASNTERIVHSLEAWMPEPIALVKLRGFFEDLGARVIESVPGLICVRVGEPKVVEPKGIFRWLPRPKVPPSDPPPVQPIALDLHLTKRLGGANRLEIRAVFTALEGPLPNDPRWHHQVKKLFNDLKAYLIAQQ